MRTAEIVRRRIEQEGERLWRLEDFRGLPPGAVAQVLSRLARAGMIERLSKGTYYRARETPFGRSRPNPAAIQRLMPKGKPMFASGTSAANLLGFSAQAAKRREVSTSALSLPRKLLGSGTRVHTRRPEAWARLSETEAALLDFLRNAGRTSELPPEETVRRTISLLDKRGCFRRLLAVAYTEPPRLRAVLGALGEELGRPAAELKGLRQSLNPLSRFEFGVFVALPTANAWQAKARR